jgi:hypothetical protein
MNIDQVKEYVTTQLKSYRVKDILDNFSDKEWRQMYKQIAPTKPHEVQRRLIDYAVMELDKFRYVLYKERHYEDLLIDKACLECLRCSDLSWQEKRHYDRRPDRKGEKNEQ